MSARSGAGSEAREPRAPVPPVALVTGASSGIGLAVAEAYARRGSPLVLNARDEARLTAVAERLGARTPPGPTLPDPALGTRPAGASRIEVVAGDVGRAETGQRMVAAAVKRFGRVDVLVNSAGVFAARPFLDYGEEELDAFYRINLRGAFLVTQAAARQMRAQGGGGAIVHVTASIALQPLAAALASAPIAFKGGLNALTRALALELAPEQIRVNAVAPGIIRTPLLRLSDEQFAAMGGLQPIGHVGEASHIADAILHLAGAEFTTGVVLPVDGGMASGHW